MIKFNILTPALLVVAALVSAPAKADVMSKTDAYWLTLKATQDAGCLVAEPKPLNEAIDMFLKDPFGNPNAEVFIRTAAAVSGYTFASQGHDCPQKIRDHIVENLKKYGWDKKNPKAYEDFVNNYLYFSGAVYPLPMGDQIFTLFN